MILSAAGYAGGELFAKGSLEDQRSALELERSKRLLELKEGMDARAEQRRVALTDQERAAGVNRVESAQTGLINRAIDKKYSDSDTAVTAANSGQTDAQLTPEQQAVIDQSKQADRQDLLSDQNLRTKAAIQTGDISPKDAAILHNKDESLDSKLQIAQLRNESFSARTQAQLELGQAKIEAALAKAGNSNTDFDKKIKLLRSGGASDKDIASFITDRKQPSLEDLANGFLKADPNAGTKKAMTPENAYAKAKTLRSLTKSLGDDEETPDPTPPAGKKPPVNRPPLSDFQK